MVTVFGCLVAPFSKYFIHAFRKVLNITNIPRQNKAIDSFFPIAIFSNLYLEQVILQYFPASNFYSYIIQLDTGQQSTLYYHL